MSTGILLFGLVAAALLTTGQLQEDGPPLVQEGAAPFVREIKLNPDMQIHFPMKGRHPFRFDFLTDNCSIALRIIFHPMKNKDNIIMNTLYAQGWGNEKRTRHQFQSASAVTINVTDDAFSIGMRHDVVSKPQDSHQKVAEYENRFPLCNITHVLIYPAWGRNKPLLFAVIVTENQLQNMSDWLQPGMGTLLKISGKPTSSFTIELVAPNDAVSLRMRIEQSSFRLDSRKAAQGWSNEETSDIFEMQLGDKIEVSLILTPTEYVIRANGIDQIYSYHVGPRSVHLVRVTDLAETRIMYVAIPRPTTKPVPCKADGAAMKPFALKTALKPGMEVYFTIRGVDNFRLDFLTNNCSIALRVNFQKDQNEITMNTLYAQGWGNEKSAPYRFGIYTSVWINVTDNSFSIAMGDDNSQKVAEYEYHLLLNSIRHVAAEQPNQLDNIGVVVNENQLQIMDDWFQTSLIDIDANTIIEITGILPTTTSSVTVELAAPGNAVALRVHFQNTHVSLDSCSAGGEWSAANTTSGFELQPGDKIDMMLIVNKNEYQMFVTKAETETEATYKHQVPARLVNLVKVTGLTKTNIKYATSPQPTAKPRPCEATQDQ